jgi:lysophospholipase L1-like esterase
MAKPRFIGSWWFLVLFNIALFVLLTEITLRVTGTYKNYGERNYGLFIDYFKHPYPGPLCAWAPNTTRTSATQEFDYPVTTNSLGIRDVEHTLTKPEGTKRIVILGDSFSEGAGAPFDSAWHQRMAWYIAQDSSLGNWEIINGAVSGGDPFYGYEMLRRELLAYQPDIVIQVFNATDWDDYLARGGLKRFVNDSTTQWRPKNELLHTAYKYSHIVRMIVKELLHYNDFYQSPAEQEEIRSAAMGDYEQLLIKTDSLATANGAVVFFVFQPMNYECARFNIAPQTDTLLNRLDNNGIKAINLLPLLPRNMQLRMEDYFWSIDGHMNSKGYDAWGKAMYDYFVIKGTLKQSDPQ